MASVASVDGTTIDYDIAGSGPVMTLHVEESGGARTTPTVSATR
jgi:hypothetical protein